MGVPFADVGACHPGAAHHAKSEDSEWGSNPITGQLSFPIEQRVNLGVAIIDGHNPPIHSRIAHGPMTRALGRKRYAFNIAWLPTGLLKVIWPLFTTGLTSKKLVIGTSVFANHGTMPQRIITSSRSPVSRLRRMWHVGREVFPPEPLVARVAPGS
jgi:hypothetical protein